MTERRRLPWLLSLPLMVAGSFAAHSLGVVAVAAHPVAAGDADGGVELSGRVDRGSLTVLPLIAGVGIALLLVWVAVRFFRRFRWGARGVSPLWFLALPPLGYAAQEVAERLLHAEAIPFNPAHEPAFLAGLVLQLPFGLLAYLVGRALRDLGARLVRVLSGGPLVVPGPRPSARLRPGRAFRIRVPVLSLGHSVRGPPVVILPV